MMFKALNWRNKEMKYRVSDRGTILLVEKKEALYSFLNNLIYGSEPDKDKRELTDIFFTALTAAQILDYTAVLLKTFKTANDNLVAIIPRDKDFVIGNNDADFLLGEITDYFDEFKFFEDERILNLCEDYIRIRPKLREISG